jgi:hypothetical protein
VLDAGEHRGAIAADHPLAVEIEQHIGEHSARGVARASEQVVGPIRE